MPITIVVPSMEFFDPVKNEFFQSKEQTLQLQHSLVSLAKWEQKWNKPFLSKEEKTQEEMLDYIRCMTITQNVDPGVYKRLTKENYDDIYNHINAQMTATTFSDKDNHKNSREIITAEIIYYWMITFGIPFECQKWHLNTLLTLIKVCGIKNAPSKKMSKKDILARNHSLNMARRNALGSRG